jgi:hypothetical protein
VTFFYNLLESMMQNIFVRCSPVDDDFAKRLFHKLNNRDRMDLLKAFVAENEKHQDVRDAILHCVLCYDICTENRNVLMHSIYFNPNPEMTILIKQSSNDPHREIRFDVPIADLRTIADQTAETFKYAMDLYAFIARRAWLNSFPPDHPLKQGPDPPISLPEKPSKPRKLTPYPPRQFAKTNEHRSRKKDTGHYNRAWRH